MLDQDRTPKRRKRSAVGSPPISKKVLRSAVGSLASFPTSGLAESAARMGDMIDQSAIQTVASIKESARVQNSAAARMAEMLAEHAREANSAVSRLNAVSSLASFPTSGLAESAARMGDMIDQSAIQNIAAIEESARIQNSAAARMAEMLAEHAREANSAVSRLNAVSFLASFPTSGLIESAARMGDMVNQSAIQTVASIEESARVQNSAAARMAEMLAEHAREANSAVSRLNAVSFLASFPTSGLIESAARMGDMVNQSAIQNIASMIERTAGIAASIVGTMPPLPSLTPANFDFVLDGGAKRAWKGFSDRAALLASGDEAAGEESVQALFEDAVSVAEHAPAESKGKAESLIRLVLISVFANIITEGGKALWPLLIALLTSVPVPEPPPPPAPPPLIEEASPSSPAVLVPGGWWIEGLPGLIREAGPPAEQRFVEFFTTEIRNPNTRQAYASATARFFEWCEERNLAFASVTPFVVAAYIEEMQGCYAQSTVKQHLAAIRTMFDYLVLGQVLPLNPAASVRGPNQSVNKAKTPALTENEVRALLDSIDIGMCSGVRDRALLGTMVYSFARVSAVVAMNVEDYYRKGKCRWLRLHEKRGKVHEVPAHQKAEEYLDAYLDTAGIGNRKGSPLWRSMNRERTFSENRMNRVDVFRMIKRRVRQTEVDASANCHTFRATGITAYLLNGGGIENAQAIAAHESPRTTKLYDRAADAITFDEIERIVI